jgi:hypothetical protein
MLARRAIKKIWLKFQYPKKSKKSLKIFYSVGKFISIKGNIAQTDTHYEKITHILFHWSTGHSFGCSCGNQYGNHR